MRSKCFLCGLIFLMLTTALHYVQAQDPNAIGYYEDAFTFGKDRLQGSARILGMGGVQNSLGGDLSSAYSNPAGLGFFNRSEIAITPGMSFNRVNSTYLGTSQEEFESNLFLQNIGIAIETPFDDITSGPWKGGTLGITYSRSSDLNRKKRYLGYNGTNDIIDYYAQQHNNAVSNQFPEYNINNETDILPGTLGELAYINYMVDPEPGDPFNIEDDSTVYLSDSLIRNPLITTPQESEVQQSETIEEEGKIGTWNFSYGLNYDDKLFIGGGLSISTIRYNRKKTYREEYGPQSVLLNHQLTEELTVNGSGVNAKLGVIFKPIPALNLGASLQTPTLYDLEEVNTIISEANYDNYSPPDGTGPYNNMTQEASNETNPFLYYLRTPAKYSGGATYFIGKSGFISADIEYVDYSGSNLSSDEGQLVEDNNSVNQVYKSTVNWKVGGEYRTGLLRLRAGYAFYGNPYQIDLATPRKERTYSLGAGFRFPEYYIDVAWVLQQYHQATEPYEMIEQSGDNFGWTRMQPRATSDISQNYVMATLGFNF